MQCQFGFPCLFAEFGNPAGWDGTTDHPEVGGRRVRAVDLALRLGGPLLTARGKEWVTGENPLSLYEVQEVTPGEGLEVKDLLRSNAPVVKVTERSASRTLVNWDIFGARIARRPDGHAFSGAA